MKTAHEHEARLESSRLYQRRQWEGRQAMDRARLRAFYYLDEKRADVWPFVMDHLTDARRDA